MNADGCSSVCKSELIEVVKQKIIEQVEERKIEVAAVSSPLSLPQFTLPAQLAATGSEFTLFDKIVQFFRF